jgi:membrane protein DedA with SNARE-associated domain
MDFFLNTALEYLLLYKYIALFVISFLAALALPIPSAAPLMAAAALSGQGTFHIAWVILVASIGNILGDNVGYWLSRLYGKPVLYKLGYRKFLDSPALRIIEKYIGKHPTLTIFASRFEVIATISVNILSGLGRIPYGQYLAYEASGEVFQVLIYASIGYSLGNNWKEFNTVLGQVSFFTTVAVAIFLLFFSKKVMKKLADHIEGR